MSDFGSDFNRSDFDSEDWAPLQKHFPLPAENPIAKALRGMAVQKNRKPTEYVLRKGKFHPTNLWMFDSPEAPTTLVGTTHLSTLTNTNAVSRSERGGRAILNDNTSWNINGYEFSQDPAVDGPYTYGIPEKTNSEVTYILHCKGPVTTGGYKGGFLPTGTDTTGADYAELPQAGSLTVDGDTIASAWPEDTVYIITLKGGTTATAQYYLNGKSDGGGDYSPGWDTGLTEIFTSSPLDGYGGWSLGVYSLGIIYGKALTAAEAKELSDDLYGAWFKPADTTPLRFPLPDTHTQIVEPLALPAQSDTAKALRGMPTSPLEKPTEEMTVDWGHPLAEGLVFAAFLLEPGIVHDLAKDRALTPPTGAAWATSYGGETGLMMNSTNSGYVTIGELPLNWADEWSATFRFSRYGSNAGAKPAILQDVLAGNRLFNILGPDYATLDRFYYAIRDNNWVGANTNTSHQPGWHDNGFLYKNGDFQVYRDSVQEANHTETLSTIGMDCTSSFLGLEGAAGNYYKYLLIHNRKLSKAEYELLRADPYKILKPKDSTPLQLPAAVTAPRTAKELYLPAYTDTAKALRGMPSSPQVKPQIGLKPNSEFISKYDVRFAHIFQNSEAGDQLQDVARGNITKSWSSVDRVYAGGNSYLEFNANTDEIQIARSEALEPKNITLLVKVRLVDVGSGNWLTIVSKDYTSFAAPYYSYGLRARGGVYDYFTFICGNGTTNGGSISLSIASYYGQDIWLAGSYDGTEAASHIFDEDGNHLASSTPSTAISGDIVHYNTDLHIGDTHANTLKGLLGDCRLYETFILGRSLNSAAEISQFLKSRYSVAQPSDTTPIPFTKYACASGMPVLSNLEASFIGNKQLVLPAHSDTAKALRGWPVTPSEKPRTTAKFKDGINDAIAFLFNSSLHDIDGAFVVTKSAGQTLTADSLDQINLATASSTFPWQDKLNLIDDFALYMDITFGPDVRSNFFGSANNTCSWYCGGTTTRPLSFYYNGSIRIDSYDLRYVYENKRTRILVSRRGGTFRLYINGVKDNEVVYATNRDNGTDNDFELLGDAGFGSEYACKMHGFAMFGSGLTEGQELSLAANGWDAVLESADQSPVHLETDLIVDPEIDLDYP